MSRPLRIAPSLLSADFAHLADSIALVEGGGADLLHVDVMDGHFVPNLTLGPPVVASIHKVARVPLDVHLMLTHPGDYVEPFAHAGAAGITFHVEAEQDPAEVIARIRAAGLTVGLALSPPTPYSRVRPYLDAIDMLLVMTVNPGFAGQSFLGDALEKAEQARREGSGNLDIQVDGGISRDTIGEAAAAGASVFVAGSAIFRAQDPAAEVRNLREVAVRFAATRKGPRSVP